MVVKRVNANTDGEETVDVCFGSVQSRTNQCPSGFDKPTPLVASSDTHPSHTAPHLQPWSCAWSSSHCLQLHWQYTSHPRFNTSKLATRCIDVVESQHRQREVRSEHTHLRNQPLPWQNTVVHTLSRCVCAMASLFVLRCCNSAHAFRQGSLRRRLLCDFCRRVTCHASLPLLPCSSACKSRVFPFSVEDHNFWNLALGRCRHSYVVKCAASRWPFLDDNHDQQAGMLPRAPLAP